MTLSRQSVVGQVANLRPVANRPNLILLLLTVPLFAQTDPADKIAPELKKMIEVFATVEQESADPVSLDAAIYGGAIPGMLHTLDPHS